MNKKMVHHPLFQEPVELPNALVAAASLGADGPEYDLMMDAAVHIRSLEAKIDFLYSELMKREEIINKIPYGTYSWRRFDLANQDDICVTHTVDLGDNNECV